MEIGELIETSLRKVDDLKHENTISPKSTTREARMCCITREKSWKVFFSLQPSPFKTIKGRIFVILCY